MTFIRLAIVLVLLSIHTCEGTVTADANNFEFYECSEVPNKYIKSKSNIKTDFITAKNFCEAQGARMPLFRTNDEIRSVFECLNDGCNGCASQQVAILIGVNGTEYVWLEEPMDQSMWHPNDPNGGCQNPSGIEFCCARLDVADSLKGADLEDIIKDYDNACELASYPFLCEVDPVVEKLGNECNDGSHGCSHSCTDEFLGYTCSCPVGYELQDDERTCVDVDECNNTVGLVQQCEHRCNNTEGSFTCLCNEGYQPSTADFSSCENINECTSGAAKCNQSCIDTNGSYTCECNAGYMLGENLHDCIDVNECDTETHMCNQSCVNTLGSYSCECFPGYNLANDSFSCHDVDECVEGTHMCNQSCVNTLGSYACQCSTGFKLANDSFDCDDVDECVEGTHMCNQSCINTLGSYACQCSTGYRLANDSFNCDDVDECQSDENTNGSVLCDGEQECINTIGSYDCRCPSGSLLPSNTTCPESCTCDCQGTSNITDEDLEKLREEITQLVLDRHDLSSYIRAKSTAKDSRWSAQAIGSTGVIFVTLTFSAIVLLDLNRWYKLMSKSTQPPKPRITPVSH